MNTTVSLRERMITNPTEVLCTNRSLGWFGVVTIGGFVHQ